MADIRSVLAMFSMVLAENMVVKVEIGSL